jgi:hypothetical protein
MSKPIETSTPHPEGYCMWKEDDEWYVYRPKYEYDDRPLYMQSDKEVVDKYFTVVRNVLKDTEDKGKTIIKALRVVFDKPDMKSHCLGMAGLVVQRELKKRLNNRRVS